MSRACDPVHAVPGVEEPADHAGGQFRLGRESAAATVHLAIPSTKEAIPFDLCICASEVLGGDRPLHVRRAASRVVLSSSHPPHVSCVSDEFGRRIGSALA
jgi:hypothetical protein